MVIKQVELQHVCGITSKLPDTGQVEVYSFCILK